MLCYEDEILILIKNRILKIHNKKKTACKFCHLSFVKVGMNALHSNFLPYI